MSSLGEELGGALKSGICAALKANNALNDFVSDLVGDNQGSLSILGRLIYSKYCSDPPPAPESPPFTGGQCQFCYAVAVTRTVDDPGGPTTNGQATNTLGLWGPIGWVGKRETDEGSVFRRHEVVFSSFGSCTAPRLAAPIETAVANDLLLRTGTFTIDRVLVTPVGGVPDTCGDPPIPPPTSDPDSRRFPIDFDFTYEDGTDFNITGIVNFGVAYFDTDFNVNVNLNFQIEPNISFTGNINLDTGDLVINWGSDQDYPTRPRPEGDYPIDPTNPAPPPTSFPAPPSIPGPRPPNPNPSPESPDDYDPDQPADNKAIRRIIGVLVDTARTSKTVTTIGQDINPDVQAPDLGLINFAYLIGGTRLYWGEDVRVKNKRQVIFTPEGRYAIAVEGTPRAGTVWVLTPIYAAVEDRISR